MSEKFNFNNEQEIEEYVNNIITSKKTEVDPYFDEMAGNLLKIIIMYVLENEPEENYNINRCIEIVKENAGKSSEKSELTSKINALGFGNKINLLYTPIKIAPEKTFKEIFENLKNKLVV